MGLPRPTTGNAVTQVRGKRASLHEERYPLPPSDDVAALWVERVIGKRHRVVRHVATGGMGHVFLAQHVVLGSYVAVKILVDGSNETLMRYFGHEAQLLARLRHPNIVGIVDCGMLSEGGCYIVMEWLPGQELGTFIAENGALAPARALWVLRQLASALDYMHGEGVVHRDIKPDNVIFHPDAYDAVKLFDFGVAVPFRAQPASEVGQVIGTPHYMSPEQAAGECASPSSDLYALGALALELFTGRRAYEQTSAGEVVTAVLTTPPNLPSDYGLHVPGLDLVIARALARDPDSRFGSGLEFVAALQHVFQRAFAAAQPRTPRRPDAPLAPAPRPPVAVAPPMVLRVDAPRAPRRPQSGASTVSGVLTACLCGAAAWLYLV